MADTDAALEAVHWIDFELVRKNPPRCIDHFRDRLPRISRVYEESGIWESRECRARCPALSLRPSTIAAAGFGVYAERPVPEGAVVSFYGGAVLDWMNAPRTVSRHMVPAELRSHMRALFPLAYTLWGNYDPALNENAGGILSSATREDRRRLVCRGAGAWINDSRGPAESYNARFDRVDSAELNRHLLARGLRNADPRGRVIVIVATRNIRADEELFIDYGNCYWEPAADGEPRPDLGALGWLTKLIIAPKQPPRDGGSCSGAGGASDDVLSDSDTDDVLADSDTDDVLADSDSDDVLADSGDDSDLGGDDDSGDDVEPATKRPRIVRPDAGAALCGTNRAVTAAAIAAYVKRVFTA